MDKEILVAIIGGGATIAAAVIGAVIAGRRSAARRHDELERSAGAGPASQRGVDIQRRDAENRERVADALQRLMQRTSDDTFVVVEEPATGRFVQFIGDADGVLLDLPLMNLTAAERRRADTLFASRPGAELEKHAGSDSESYQLDFGPDTRLATQVAFDVFQQVYQLSPGHAIRLSEN